MKDIEFLIKLWMGRVTRFEKTMKDKIKDLENQQNSVKTVQEFNILAAQIKVLEELLDKYELILLK